MSTPWPFRAPTPPLRTRQTIRALIVVIGAAALWPAAAFAQSDADVAQAIGRAEAAIALVTSSPGAPVAPASAQIAADRLTQARAARDARDRTTALWRAQEAELEAAVAVAEIRRAVAERRAQELNDAVSALEREAQS